MGCVKWAETFFHSDVVEPVKGKQRKGQLDFLFN